MRFRSSRSLLVLPAALALALAAAAAPAHAATVRETCTTSDGGRGPEPGCDLRFTAGAGEANRLTISGAGRTVTFSDPAARITAQGTCHRVSVHRARCTMSASQGGPTSMSTIALGDRADRVRILGSLGSLGGTLDTGSGNDRVDATHAVLSATVDGGPGNDVLLGGPGRDRFSGGPGSDRLTGGSGGDVLDGGSGRDTVEGGAGDDFLIDTETMRTAVPDRLDGGPGRDTVSFAARAAGVHVDLERPGDAGYAGERDRLSSIENVTGSVRDNVLLGDNHANVLVAGGAFKNDRGETLFGRGGNDTLAGGSRFPNHLYGGPGNDLLFPAGGRVVIRTRFDLPISLPRRDIVDCGPGNDVVVPSAFVPASTIYIPRSCERVELRAAGRTGIDSFFRVLPSFGQPVVRAGAVSIDARFTGHSAKTEQTGYIDMLRGDGTLLGRAPWASIHPAHQTLRFLLTAAGRASVAAHAVVNLRTSPDRADWRVHL